MPLAISETLSNRSRLDQHHLHLRSRMNIDHLIAAISRREDVEVKSSTKGELEDADLLGRAAGWAGSSKSSSRLLHPRHKAWPILSSSMNPMVGSSYVTSTCDNPGRQMAVPMRTMVSLPSKWRHNSRRSSPWITAP